MTPPIEPHDRLTEIKSIHRDYHNFYQLLRGVVLVAVLAGIGVLIFSSDLPSYWQNIYVTIVGAIGTVLIIDQRAEQRAIKERKDDLIVQMGSSDNGVALRSVLLLDRKGWLRDGSLHHAVLMKANLKEAFLINAAMKQAILTSANLQGACLLNANLWGSDFSGANLEGAELTNSDLRRSRLYFANLEKSALTDANLEEAWLHHSSLKHANLLNANFQDAMMWQADLRDAKLGQTNLQGADMLGANIQGVDITQAIFGSSTRLPDGTMWTPETDMTRFSDSNHPRFWRSKDIYSSFYYYPQSEST